MKEDICQCADSDADAILHVINCSAIAYDEILSCDFATQTYMTSAQLLIEMELVEFFGVRDNDDIVAVMGYQRCLDLALIRHSYVILEFQRQGLGSSLLRHLEDRAVQDGYDELLVGLYSENGPALSFYRQHGFTEAADSQLLLSRYWDIPDSQAVISVVLAKKI